MNQHFFKNYYSLWLRGSFFRAATFENLKNSENFDFKDTSFPSAF